MKKILVSLVAMLMTAPSFAQLSSGGFELDKESVYYGVRFGGTIASINGDCSLGAKTGMTLAGVLGLRLSETTPVFLESGLYYTQRGGKGEYKGNTWEVVHNNIEIPLLIKYGFKVSDDFAILPYVGPYFAYAVSKEQKNKTETPGYTDSYPRVNRNNMGFKLGCGAEYHKLYIEVGYQIGVTNILDDEDWDAKNNAFFANFGINF
jgi:hypothetical protein